MTEYFLPYDRMNRKSDDQIYSPTQFIHYKEGLLSTSCYNIIEGYFSTSCQIIMKGYYIKDCE